jgi:predicted ATP-dependent serine protease
LAKTGLGQTVKIAGEPGIGKSRLALELIDKTGSPTSGCFFTQP